MAPTSEAQGNKRPESAAAHSAKTRFARVAFIDDERTFAEAMALALQRTEDMRIVCTAPCAITGFAAVERVRPDLVVVDYRLQGAQTGVDLARKIRHCETTLRMKHRMPIVLLSAYSAPRVLRDAGDIAGMSILSKEMRLRDILDGFRRALAGHESSGVTSDVPHGLSPAEIEVLEYMALGRNATEMARELCVSVHAIRARIKGTLRKMGASNQLQAVAMASSLGLVVPPRPPDTGPAQQFAEPTKRMGVETSGQAAATGPTSSLPFWN